jgi:hypothetical protein
MADFSVIIVAIASVCLLVILMIASIYLYFLPSMIARKRKIVHQTLVMILNLLLGWTGIAWIGMLLVALLDEKKKPVIENPDTNS